MTAKQATLKERIKLAVVESPYFSGCGLRVKAKEDCVVVEGIVDTYFHKQMAQETLLRVDGVRRIDNRLRVALRDCEPRHSERFGLSSFVICQTSDE